MKKLLAIVIVVMMLAAMVPAASAAATETAAPEDAAVNISITVSVDGKLEVAAEPLTVNGTTADDALKAAHAKWYSGGEAGYVAGIDPTWNMYLITQCWGVVATPFVIVNGAPMGAAGVPNTADAVTLHNGDNIVVSVSSSADVAALAIGLKVELADGKANLSATSWVLDMTTFAYTSAPLADAEVTDPATGTSLGKTDAEGKLTLTPPESGVVAVSNSAAIRVDGSAISDEDLKAALAADSANKEKLPLFYSVTYELIIWTCVLLIPVFIAVIINLSNRKKIDKQASAAKR